MPIIIGEFHFGALDRGMFHTGLRKTANQEDRADKYRSYVQGALRNPYIVGTHWFQYKDQATTGRGDGENYQIGFIDICDKPYPEIVRACREVGYNLYETKKTVAKAEPISVQITPPTITRDGDIESPTLRRLKMMECKALANLKHLIYVPEGYLPSSDS